MNQDVLAGLSEALTDIITTDALRSAVRVGSLRRRTQWVCATGLDASDTAAHQTFLASVGRCGFRTLDDEPVTEQKNELVILDWSRVTHVRADAAAVAALFARALHEQGKVLLGCASTIPHVADAIAATHAAADVERWFGTEPAELTTSGNRKERVDVVLPIVRFSNDINGRIALAESLDTLQAALATRGLNDERLSRIMAVVNELTLNAIQHPLISDRVLVVLIDRRRRPPLLEIGLADDGPGIGATLVREARHAWVDLVSDRGATSATFGGNLSSRPLDEGGGGMTRAVQDLVRETQATVTVRSGGGRMILSPGKTGALRSRSTGFTHGWGTQIRVDVPLRI